MDDKTYTKNSGDIVQKPIQSIVPFIKSQSIVDLSEGDEILSKHEFFRDLANLLETKEFNTFFHKHMNSMDEIKGSMVYIKLYDAIKKKLPIKILEDKVITQKFITVMLHKFITNREYRGQIIETTMDFMEKGKNTDLIETISRRIMYEKYLKTGIALDPDVIIEAHQYEINRLKKIKKKSRSVLKGDFLDI